MNKNTLYILGALALAGGAYYIWQKNMANKSANPATGTAKDGATPTTADKTGTAIDSAIGNIISNTGGVIGDLIGTIGNKVTGAINGGDVTDDDIYTWGNGAD